MAEKKSILKRFLSTSNVLIVLIALSFGIIGYVAARDYFMSPENKLYSALEYMKADKPFKAERYFIMATKSKNILIARLSTYYLGNLYLKGANGFKENHKKAEQYLIKSADLGDIRAAYELALLYDVGDMLPENRDKAIIYMVKAADGGYADALYAMGVWGERGYMGEIPFSSIVKVYEIAAAKGQRNAMKSLVAIYQSGYGNFPYNVERMNFWMDKLKETSDGK